MKVKYLGTAAAEGIPALFCECDNCKKARELGGRNIRSRSQAIINNELLIDFPADTFMHFLQYNLPLSKIKHCLITHSHSDHLYPAEIEMRITGFAHMEDKEPMTFYSDVSGYNMLQAEIDNRKMSEVKAELLELNKPFKVMDYTVTAIRAAHGETSSPVVFIIEKDGKTFFYSNDTSEYPEESWEYLKTLKKPFDVISLDCTEACGKCTYVGHLTLDRCIALREELKRVGVADENTRFLLTHFSHNGVNVTYDDFVKIAGAEGFDVTYDGMEIDV